MPTDDSSIAKPWSWREWDVNGDDQFTIGDIVLWLKEAFFLPGDWSIWLLSETLPGMARFLELDASDYGGLLSGFLSAFIWLAGLLTVLIVMRMIKRLDEALTQSVRRVYDEGLRQSRLAWVGLRHRLRGRAPRDPSPQIEFSEGIELSPEQSRVLQRLLDVPAPYALSLADIATDEELGRSEAADLVARLKALDLVSVVDGGAYDERGFAITAAGRAYLIFKQLAPRG